MGSFLRILYIGIKVNIQTRIIRYLVACPTKSIIPQAQKEGSPAAALFLFTLFQRYFSAQFHSETLPAPGGSALLWPLTAFGNAVQNENPQSLQTIHPLRISIVQQSCLSRTSRAKSSKESPVRCSAPSTKLKKQFGISPSRRFLAMHGAQPLPCLAGCRGHSKFVHVQNLLRFSIFILLTNKIPLYLTELCNS